MAGKSIRLVVTFASPSFLWTKLCFLANAIVWSSSSLKTSTIIKITIALKATTLQQVFMISMHKQLIVSDHKYVFWPISVFTFYISSFECASFSVFLLDWKRPEAISAIKMHALNQKKYISQLEIDFQWETSWKTFLFSPESRTTL